MALIRMTNTYKWLTLANNCPRLKVKFNDAANKNKQTYSNTWATRHTGIHTSDLDWDRRCGPCCACTPKLPPLKADHASLATKLPTLTSPRTSASGKSQV